MLTKTDVGRGGATQKEEGEELFKLMTTPPVDDGGGDDDGKRTTLDNIESQYDEVSQLVHQEEVVEAAPCSNITTGKTTTTTLP